MIAIDKIDERSVGIKIYEREFTAPAVFEASASGDQVEIKSKRDATFYLNETRHYTEVLINGAAAASAAEAAIELNQFIGNFKSGGGSPGTTPPQPKPGQLRIRFISPVPDAAGENIIAIKWADKGGSVTYPPHPAVEYLTPDGWTHDLSELTNIESDIDVGAQYKTSDGKTHVFGTVTPGTGQIVSIRGSIVGTATFRINWMDGSYNDFSSLINYSKTFPFGNYHFTIERISGSGRMVTSGGTQQTQFIGAWGNAVHTLKRLYIGDFVDWGRFTIDSNSFLEAVVIPSNLTAASQVSFGMNGSRGLLCAVFPKGDYIIWPDACRDAHSLRYVVYPSARTSIGSNDGNRSLRSIVLPKGITNTQGLQFAQCSSLRSIVIPELVSSIGTSSFSNLFALQYYVFLPKVPPTIPVGVLSGGLAVVMIMFPTKV